MASFLRRLAERSVRNVSFPARLPKRFGGRRMWLSPGNQLAILKFGEAKFNRDLLGFAERFVDPGAVVWDIGANMGLFAIPAAHRASLTVAVEPDPFNLALLHRSRRANPDLVIDILPAAVSGTLAVGRLGIAERGRAANSLAGHRTSTQMGGVRDEFPVVTVTADWMLDNFPAPDFVKCDAESAELTILEGATRLLAEARPVIVIEVDGANAKGCAAIFRANNYAMLSAYAPVDPAKAVEEIGEIWDLLAIPREKLAAMKGR